VQNPLRKHYRAFVKVAEGSEIYNFPIHRLVHFSSKIGSKTCSKWPRIKLLRKNQPRRDVARAGAPAPRRTRRTTGPRSHALLPEADAHPKVCAPRPHTARASWESARAPCRVRTRAHPMLPARRPTAARGGSLLLFPLLAGDVGVAYIEA
jgi:hypothetical protein